MLLTTTHYFVFRTALLAKPKPAKPSSNQTIHGEICENKHGKKCANMSRGRNRIQNSHLDFNNI